MLDRLKFAHPFFHERHVYAPNPFRACRCLAIWLFLLSCGITPPAPRETQPGKEKALLPGYIIECIIHGDGDYTFHDPDGNRHRADEETLAGAKKVAERNSQAEVFIFHEKRKSHFLLFFPRHDGEFYYYRNGRLLAQESYWRDRGQSRFDPEVEIYHRFHAEERPRPVRLFLYFGHEIPEIGGTNYDALSRHKPFNVHALVDGLKGFTVDSTKFDLMVLSTCFNGTPHTVAALAPYARYIIASPSNLHLSYFDLRPLETLDVGLRDGDISAYAKEFARQAFDRLTKDIQTEITVAVYDVDRVRRYVNSVDSIYNHDLTTLSEKPPVSVEHCDCAENAAYAQPAMSDGIDLFYRPASFGRSKHKQSHSGWECYKLSK